MEEMSKKDIKEDVYDKESALQFLARRKVIPNEIVCKKCELEATIQFISHQRADSDGYIWKCGGCGYSWTMRNGPTLPKGRASLQDILFKFCSIFDLKGRPTRERKIAIAASPYILSTTFKIMKKSLKLGGENVVYFDVISSRGSHQPICVAVEKNSNLTMVDTDLSTFLDKWSGQGCNIVHRNVGMDGKVLSPAAMKCSTCHYTQERESLEALLQL